MNSRNPNLLLQYQRGFGNELASEAVAGALPAGQNSPQDAPRGLYTEQVSGTAFTAPRAENRRTWLYKMRPSAMHGRFQRMDDGLLRSGPFEEVDTPPNRLRWDPLPVPSAPTDVIDGLVTMAGSGAPNQHSGFAVHVYRANRSMAGRCFTNADGEFILVPQLGRLLLVTELGRLEVGPGEVAIIPRGYKFRVELLEKEARGWLGENYGAPFRLPELGPIGANGLANPQDFLAPVAAYEDQPGKVEIVAKMLGKLWRAELGHSPFDVVAWRGNYTPCKYDLSLFMAINTVSYDHCDPSIATVLTSPSYLQPGVANCDFVVFPPRWMVAEHTFRPPWFHRNVMSEWVGLIEGAHEVHPDGYRPGGMHLHNCMAAHGPSPATFDKAAKEEMQPRYLDGTLTFMFESRHVFQPTRFALESPALQRDYDTGWNGFRSYFTP